MKLGALILVLIPISLALMILNCVSWVLVRLRGSGLPVRLGTGWPWTFYTCEVNRVGPSHFEFTSLLLDIGAALGILLAAAALTTLIGKLAARK